MSRHATALFHGSPVAWQAENNRPYGRPLIAKASHGEKTNRYGNGKTWYASSSKDVASRYGSKSFGWQHLANKAKEIGFSESFSQHAANAFQAGMCSSDFVQIALDEKTKHAMGGCGFGESNLQERILSLWASFDPRLHLYRLSMNTQDTVSLLNGDARIDEQSAQMRDGLVCVLGNLITPQKIESLNVGALLKPLHVDADVLLAHGIAGIVVTDPIAKARGQVASNYAIWDQQLLDRLIVEDVAVSPVTKSPLYSLISSKERIDALEDGLTADLRGEQCYKGAGV